MIPYIKQSNTKGYKMILKCTCKHKFQDKKYGKGMRVFNALVKDNEYKCTVCGNTKTSMKRPSKY